jgi:hypothetical protein
VMLVLVDRPDADGHQRPLFLRRARQ